MKDDSSFKLGIIIAWFGKWPEWIDIFFRSCSKNVSIDFFVFTDCGDLPSMSSKNIKYNNISLADFIRLQLNTADVTGKIELGAYKLCDFKPLYGAALGEYLGNYTHWGVSDVDLIFGDLSQFIDETADVFSTHQAFVSGHFFYVRNTRFINQSFRLVRGYKADLARPEYAGFDERRWSNIHIPRYNKSKIVNIVLNRTGFRRKVVAREMHTTPHNGIPWRDGTYEYPDRWIYNGQRMMAYKGDESVEVPYLHFMNWKSSKWRPKFHPEPFWENLDLSDYRKVWNAPALELSPRGIRALRKEEV